eukprot:47724-Pelagomonas_calceolata.AAC.1
MAAVREQGFTAAARTQGREEDAAGTLAWPHIGKNGSDSNHPEAGPQVLGLLDVRHLGGECETRWQSAATAGR